ncbi:type III pantothenate kinase [Planctomycetota bacterium]
MNLIAIDIGNSNINIGLFLNDKEKSVQSAPGGSQEKLTEILKSAWQKIPILKSSKEKKRDGVIIVSSVKPAWTTTIRKIVKDSLGEKILIIGKDIPYPMDLSVKESSKVGSDRVLSAAAAYAVIEDAVAIADFGTAITIDLVDERGIFLGGVILPGFQASAAALKKATAKLPEVKVTKPKTPYGRSTEEAVNCGLYYAAVGALQKIVEGYAEKIGKWPQTVLTGAAAKVIKDDCQFIDSWVPNLVIKGIALAYRKHIENL